MNPNAAYTLVALLTLFIAYRELSPVFRRIAARRKAGMAQVNAQIMNAQMVSAQTSAQANELAGLLIGTTKACQAIATATVDLKDSVNDFRAMLTAPKTYPADNIQQPASEDRAELAAMTFERILRGMPVAEAEQEAADQAEKKMMISATAMGMED